MEAFFAKLPQLTDQHPRAAAVWDAIAAPTTSDDIVGQAVSLSFSTCPLVECRMTRARHKVIVNHAGCLHEGIADR